MALVMTIKSGKNAEVSTEVHVLNVGETFPNFGGSRHGLVVRRSASIIVRTRDEAGGLSDVEYDLADKGVWAWLTRLLNGDAQRLGLHVVSPVAAVQGREIDVR